MYSELAEYFVSSLKYLMQNQSNIEIKVVHWPINDEAPFEFDFPKNIEFIDKSKLSNRELIALAHKFRPHAIVCSGWMDKDYLKVCKRHFNRCNTVVTMDNQWNGTFKQKVLTMISPYYLQTIFHSAWVPGKTQLQYAQMLGFAKIYDNFYTPDTSYFQSLNTEKPKPHRFIYIGRYVKHKGIFELWNAFTELKNEYPNDWELWCLGTGEEFNNKVEHPDIKHFGFVQPKEMKKYLKECSVFILPSTFEPWGVVVHEMAAAGFPLLLSDKVGSKTSFLRSGKNGYEFVTTNPIEIKRAMRKMMEASDEERIEMGKISFQLAQNTSQDDWVKTIMML